MRQAGAGAGPGGQGGDAYRVVGYYAAAELFDIEGPAAATVHRSLRDLQSLTRNLLGLPGSWAGDGGGRGEAR